MSADVVNLRLARKAKRREAATVEAATQRAKHGRTRAERAAAKADIDRTARHLDGHRLTSSTEEPDETPGPAHGGAS